MTTEQDDSKRSEIEMQIERIAEQFLDELIDGQVPNRQQIVAEHPHLSPYLDNRLGVIELLRSRFRVDSREGCAASSGGAGITVGQAASRFDCPHCGNQLQLVEQKGTIEVTCGGCGSNVMVDTNDTRSFSLKHPIPEKIGRFPIISHLGQGGFGVVYKAWDERLSRHVAIKIPRENYFEGAIEKERFFREASNAGRLRHANIVHVHDVSEADGVPFIVSDFVDGLTLADLISGRRLSFRESAVLMLDITEAIVHAHEHHIIHRDIKPSNILLDSQLKPHVTDFGLARDSSAEIAITAHGEVLGTPAYMSPEQAQGLSQQIDFRSDVYSLGVMFYRLLCGELPFRGSKRMLLHQLVHDEPPSISRINDEVPRDLETITLKAMSKEPQQRYPNARELADEIRRWLNHEPIRARPVSRFSRFVKWCRRRPLVASLTFTAIGFAILTCSIAAIWATRERAMHQVAQQRFEQAQQSNVRSVQRLVQLFLANGTQSMFDNKLVDSMLWFGQAAATELNEHAAHRLRTSIVSDQCPTLSGFWSVNGRVVSLGFVNNDEQFFAVTESGSVFFFPTRNPLDSGQEIDCSEPLHDAKLSKDGQLILARADRGFHLLSIANENRVSRLSHEATVAGYAFSTDSQRFATSDHAGQVQLWTRQGLAVTKLEHRNKYVTFVEFSPDGKLLATVSRPSASAPSEITLWNIEEHQAIHTFSNDVHVNAVRFDSAGRRLVASDNLGLVRIWDVDTGEELGAARRFSAPIRELHSLQKSDIVLVSTADGRVIQWDTASDSQIEPQILHAKEPVATAIAKADHFVATAHRDGNVRLSWLKYATPLCTDLPAGEVATQIAIASNDRIVLTGDSQGIVKQWDLAGTMPTATRLPHSGPVVDAKFDSSGSKMVSISRDGTGQLWKVPSGQPLGASLKHAAAILDVDFQAKGDFVATASNDGSAQIWDAHNGQRVGAPLKHDNPVFRLSFNEQDQLFTGDSAGVIRAWKLFSQQPLFELQHGQEIRALKAASNHLLSASKDKTMCIWDTTSGAGSARIVTHEDVVTYCQASDNGKWAISCSHDGVAKLIPLVGNEAPLELKHSGLVTSGEFGCHDRLVVTTTSSGSFQVWEFREDDKGVDKLTAIPIEGTSISYGQFHPSRKWIAVCGEDASTKSGPHGGFSMIWDLDTETPLSPPLHCGGTVRRVRFQPAGPFLLTAASDNSARLWPLTPDPRDVDELLKLYEIYRGKSIDRRGTLQLLSPQTQMELYRSLVEKHPGWFTCTGDEISEWNEYVNHWRTNN
jgi:eukaryotic-like serine/threonine-protein kinase